MIFAKAGLDAGEVLELDACAAKTLGISRRSLYRLIKKHHLDDTRNDGEA